MAASGGITAMPSLLSDAPTTDYDGPETVATEFTRGTCVTASSSREAHTRGSQYAAWVRDRAVRGMTGTIAAASYDKYGVRKFSDPPPDAASRLSSLDYFSYEEEDERTWRSSAAAFSKERRFPRLKQYDTKGRTFGFRKKRVVLHERFHDVDRGRRRRSKRAPYRSHWGLSPERMPPPSSYDRLKPGPGTYEHRDPWAPDVVQGDVARTHVFRSTTSADPFRYKSCWGKPHAGFNTAAAIDSPCPYDLPAVSKLGRSLESPFRAKTHRFDDPKPVVAKESSVREDPNTGAPVLAIGNVTAPSPTRAPTGVLRKARPRTPNGNRPHTVVGCALEPALLDADRDATCGHHRHHKDSEFDHTSTRAAPFGAY